jgi:hypothetical protein
MEDGTTMASYEIVPGQGVGEVRFGEERAEHRRRLGDDRITFERVPGSGWLDAYFDNTLILAYDDDDRLKEIELGGVDAFLEGVQLLDRPLGEVLDELRAANLAPEFAGDVAFSIPGLEVYLISPAPEEIEEPTESVSIRPFK